MTKRSTETLRRILGLVVRVAATAVVAGAVSAFAQSTPADDPMLAEARRAYDATDYEHARELLDSVIAEIGRTSRPEQRPVLGAAYELRARTRFNLKNEDGARTDFRAMLLVDPQYQLAAQVGPRVLALFEEVKKTTVGSVAVKVTPADAVVTLDESKIPSEVASLNLAGGTHTIAATRTGYGPTTQSFTVVPGTDPQTIALVLERISSTIAVITSPANVEVLVDGVSRGVTEPDLEAKPGASGPVSKRFVLADMQNGRHRFEFRRDCYIGTQQEFDVARPSDYQMDPVSLVAAVATVSFDANVPGATVFIDDAPRGPVPLTISDICEGSHTIEVRSAFGRHLKRLELKPGQREVFQARIRPAFAIVSDSGAAGEVRGGADIRLVGEAAFQDTNSITLFAPPAKRVSDLLTADQLPVDWLAFDLIGRPIGKASTIGDPARVAILSRLAKSLNVQGIAAVARNPGGDQSDMLLMLFAPGSAVPDVVRWRTDGPLGVREAVRLLDQVPQLFHSSIGVAAIDVQDTDAAVVVAVSPGSGAEAAGIKVGDAIVSAGGAAVTSVVQLTLSIEAHPAGKPLAIEVKDLAGVSRKADVTVQAIPNVVSLADQALLSNALALQYGYRSSSLADALEEVTVRLNIAALALRLRNRVDAIRELEGVARLTADGRVPPSLADAVNGTTQYLLGLALNAEGDVTGAERAWRTAAQSRSSLLVDNGEPIKELSEQRLKQSTALGAGRR